MALIHRCTREVGMKTDENGQKNIYPVFTFTFFSRTKMKIGMTKTKMNGTNPDRNILETVGNR
jgi:hypothetical protein